MLQLELSETTSRAALLGRGCFYSHTQYSTKFEMGRDSPLLLIFISKLLFPPMSEILQLQGNMGYHIVVVCCLVTWSCPTLCNTMDCSLQGLLSIGFPKRENWSGLPFPSQGDLPDPGMEAMSPTLAGRFFTTEPPALAAIIYLLLAPILMF